MHKLWTTSLILIFLLTGCKQIESDEALKSKIIFLIDKGDSILDLQQLMDFDWQSMLIIGPYTDVDKLEDELDINLSTIKHSNIYYRDDINQLVFLNERKNPVRMIEYPRLHDFVNRTSIKIISKERARFRVVKFKLKDTGDHIYTQLQLYK